MSDDSKTPSAPAKQSFLRKNGWKIAYFAFGVLFIVLSRFFVPFWPRFIILAAWAMGMALIFIRQLESTKD